MGSWKGLPLAHGTPLLPIGHRTRLLPCGQRFMGLVVQATVAAQHLLPTFHSPQTQMLDSALTTQDGATRQSLALCKQAGANLATALQGLPNPRPCSVPSSLATSSFSSLYSSSFSSSPTCALMTLFWSLPSLA